MPTDAEGGRSLQDEELVDRARSGEVSAYEELVGRHQEVAFRTAFLITRNAADAEDATQDAFVKAYYALPRFRAGGSFRPWLLRIVANESKNRRRSDSRREGLTLRFAAQHREASAASPEWTVLQQEEGRALLAAIEHLGENDRLVIACRYFLELTELETAEALGVRPGTVKSRLSRALDRLRAELPHRAEDDPKEAMDG